MKSRATRIIVGEWLAFLVICIVAGPLPAAPPVGAGVAWEFLPQLSDEFDTQHANPRGDGLDDSKWFDHHPVWSGRLPSQFSPANSWVDDNGKLNLRTTSRVDSLSEVNDLRNDHWVDSAAVVSRVRAQVGGYYEASIKAADISAPSSFWFRMGRKSEIDVIENIGRPSRPELSHRRTEMSYNTHFYNPPPDIAIGGREQMTDENGDPLFSSENFITYATWWKSPTEVLFYYNDIEVANVTPAGLFDEDLHMIFDMEIFHWVGFPTLESLNDPTRNTMQVDWVRSYRAVELLSGDYDANATIDSADYQLWVEQFGEMGDGLAADGNGDGRVDAADYTIWRDAFDTASVTVVPSPGAGTLTVILIAGCIFRRRHQA